MLNTPRRPALQRRDGRCRRVVDVDPRPRRPRHRRRSATCARGRSRPAPPTRPARTGCRSAGRSPRAAPRSRPRSRNRIAASVSRCAFAGCRIERIVLGLDRAARRGRWSSRCSSGHEPRGTRRLCRGEQVLRPVGAQRFVRANQRSKCLKSGVPASAVIWWMIASGCALRDSLADRRAIEPVQHDRRRARARAAPGLSGARVVAGHLMAARDQCGTSRRPIGSRLLLPERRASSYPLHSLTTLKTRQAERQ